jgi:hypothetical protein
MKIRFLLIAMLVLVAAVLGIWLMRNTEQTILPSPPASTQKQESPANAVQATSVSSEVPPESFEDVSSRVAPVVSSDTETPPSEAILSPTSTHIDVPTSGVDQAILKRVEEESVPIVDVRSVSLVVALRQYRQAFGVYPSGDSRSVSAALMGENPNRTAFIEGQGWTNKQGELLDSWGTPYIFNLESNVVTVKSSGPNKMLGDSDDVVRVKSD